MAASVVETQRTYARTCAPIQLADLEHIAAHLVKHTYTNPHWSKKAGNILATQTTLLYGLPIVAGRNVPYARHDPALAHDIFIQDALVPGDIHTRSGVIAKNRALIETLEEREHKTRSRGILADEAQQAAWYHARLPENIHSTVTLEQWLKQHGEAALTMTEADLLLVDDTPSDADYPESLTHHGQKLRLEYHFEPGGSADGVTLCVPLPALNALDATDYERLVPAMLPAVAQTAEWAAACGLDVEQARSIAQNVLVNPVDWVAECRSMAALGVRRILEIGPSGGVAMLTQAVLDGEGIEVLDVSGAEGKAALFGG